MDDNNDDPTRQRLRPAVLLDFTPGRAHDPEIGPPIGILSYAVSEQIEKPLSFPIKDVERLVIHGLVALATHGHEKAEEIIRNRYPHVIERPDIS